MEEFAPLLEEQARPISTTMAFVRFLNTLLKDKNIGKQIVPIIADEARTFGMEGLFRQIGIYSPHGQNYTPQTVSKWLTTMKTKRSGPARRYQ